MKIIRKLIVRLFGVKGYIRLASSIYIRLVGMGFLKKKYPELFYLKKIIRDGFVCIDIGANLGYYSVILSKFCGAQGKVLAVEPIPWFAEIWKKNVRRSRTNNLILLPYALGNENTTVKMGIPEVDGVVHHGMTKIISSGNDKYMHYFDVEMKIPDELFDGIERLDFIKCDVEGFESVVFSNMKTIIGKFRPLIQSELNGKENRRQVVGLLSEMGYVPKILNNKTVLTEINKSDIDSIEKDIYFVPGN
ncbi:MAG: FkbM family methyltransferase [Bacteroidetes bacterium]|nr:FkbM family methyltransferase [Bacteroidota bacterium]